MSNQATPSMVRAMANVLLDRDVDPFDQTEVIVTLIACGFGAKEVEAHFEAARCMAAMRQHHERNNG